MEGIRSRGGKSGNEKKKSIKKSYSFRRLPLARVAGEDCEGKVRQGRRCALVGGGRKENQGAITKHQPRGGFKENQSDARESRGQNIRMGGNSNSKGEGGTWDVERSRIRNAAKEDRGKGT